MAIRSLFTVILAFCASTTQIRAQQMGSTASTGVVTLSDGSTFKTTLYNMKIVGQLRATKKIPYFILSGTTCTECDENTSIYIHSPSDGAMKNGADQRRFAYPGRETDYETGQLVYEASMFFGDCLATHPNAAIWFERGIGDDKKWHSGATLVEVRNDRLLISGLHHRIPNLAEVQKAIRSKKCKQLAGIDRTSEP